MFQIMLRSIFLSISLSAIFVSCIREPESAALVKHMVVLTEYDTSQVKSSANIFNAYSTFYLRADTMGYIVNSPGTDTLLIDPIKDGSTYFVSPVIDEIRTNLEMVGFSSVDEAASPDFAVKVAALENFSYYQTISYPYYSGYYGYYGNYYPVVSTYSSNSATLVVEIVDVKNFVSNGNKYVVVWRAYIGDLITTIDITGRTIEAVDRAFQQSPYITKD